MTAAATRYRVPCPRVSTVMIPIPIPVPKLRLGEGHQAARRSSPGAEQTVTMNPANAANSYHPPPSGRLRPSARLPLLWRTNPRWTAPAAPPQQSAAAPGEATAAR